MGQTHKSILLLIKTNHCNFWIQLAEVLRLYSESRLQVINHAPGYQFLLIKVQNLYQLSKYDNDVCSKFESLQLYGRFGDGSKVYLLNCIALCQLISSFFFSSCHSTNFSPVAVLALPMLLQHISCFNKPSLHYTYTDRK